MLEYINMRIKKATILASFFIIIAIGGMYYYEIFKSHNSDFDPSIQYNEALSQLCNHYNSGLIQQNNGVFYELESTDSGFALYKGSSIDAIDEPMNISVASSGFWVKENRIYYIGGSSKNELRSVNLDGTNDTLLFSASVRDFLVSGDEIIWIDKKTGYLSRFDTVSNEQTPITDFPVIFIQEADGIVCFLAESESGDSTDYYEQEGDSPAHKVFSFPDYVQKFVRLSETTYAFSDYTVYMWNSQETSYDELLPNFETLSTSINVYDGKLVFCGIGEDGNQTYLYDPKQEDLISVGKALHQFIFSFDSGLWEYSVDGKMHRIRV